MPAEDWVSTAVGSNGKELGETTEERLDKLVPLVGAVLLGKAGRLVLFGPALPVVGVIEFTLGVGVVELLLSRLLPVRVPILGVLLPLSVLPLKPLLGVLIL